MRGCTQPLWRVTTAGLDACAPPLGASTTAMPVGAVASTVMSHSPHVRATPILGRSLASSSDPAIITSGEPTGRRPIPTARVMPPSATRSVNRVVTGASPSAVRSG
jgi:hypothetical protein